MSNAQLVVEMIISGRIVNRIISVPTVDQNHMLHICAEHLQTQVRTIIFLYIVVVHTTFYVIAPVTPMTTEKNPGQY